MPTFKHQQRHVCPHSLHSQPVRVRNEGLFCKDTQKKLLRSAAGAAKDWIDHIKQPTYFNLPSLDAQSTRMNVCVCVCVCVYDMQKIYP